MNFVSFGDHRTLYTSLRKHALALVSYGDTVLVLSLIVGAMSGILILYQIYQTTAAYKRLRHIPGPFWAPLTKFWQIKTQLQGNWYLDVKALGDKYGDIFRVGPSQVLTRDIEVVKRMAHSKSAYTKSPFYQTFRFISNQDNSFSLVDDEEHIRRRTVLGQGYAGNGIVEGCVDRQCTRLVDLIERSYISSPGQHRPLDLTAASYFFSMDCVGDLSYGGPFGCLDGPRGEDVHGFVRWNESFFPVAIIISNWHWLIRVFSHAPFNRIYPSPRDTTGVGKYLALAKDAVDKRFAQNDKEKRRDVLSAFMEHGVTKEEAINEIMLQIVAGTDSTATAIRMTLLLLLSSPRSYARLRSEIDDAYARGLISSSSSGRQIRDVEARRHLPYLQAVIREGLRVFPVVTATFYKRVPRDGGDGFWTWIVANPKKESGKNMKKEYVHLPPGTEVGVDVLGIMRKTEYWGEDADVFRPERWLEAEAEAKAAGAGIMPEEVGGMKRGRVPRTRYEVMCDALETLWGAGRYKCLGRTIAQMELNKVFVELLRRYDMSILSPQTPLRILNSGFFIMSKIEVIVTKRENKE